MSTSMLSEITETPSLAEAALREDGDLFAAIGRHLRAHPPGVVATLARGSSDHAALYAASLFGILAGRLTATLPPSLITRYDAQLDLSHALVLAISQSGASPDLVRALTVARRSGAMTVALVNTLASPLAEAAEWVLPQRAGIERAVAATKSFVLTLVAVARLTAAWTQDAALDAALTQLPERLHAALGCDWSAGLPVLAQHAKKGAYIIGRGPGLAIAEEAALKLKETSNLHAEAVSAAEIQHGPRALVDQSFPVLTFGLADPGGEDARALAQDLARAGIHVLFASAAAGGPGLHLPLPPPLHPLLDPIAAILAFYPFAEALARARGLNPDRPRGLHKITETF